MHEEQQLCTASCHGASHKVKPCPKQGLHESRAVTLAPSCHDVCWRLGVRKLLRIHSPLVESCMLAHAGHTKRFPPQPSYSLQTSVGGYWCEVCFLLGAVTAQHKSVELILTRVPSSEGA
jgi:hypothetical protein